MEPNTSWDAASCAATQKFLNILWNPNVYYSVHNSPQLVPILSQVSPVFTTHPISPRSILMLSTHLRHSLPSGLLPSGWCLIHTFSACNRTIKNFIQYSSGARGSVVGWGTMLQAGRSRVPFPMSLDFFNWPNLSCRTTALRSTQSLKEMCTRNLSQPYGPPRLVTEIALLFLMYSSATLQRRAQMEEEQHLAGP
jgi:hypothetical protein